MSDLSSNESERSFSRSDNFTDQEWTTLDQTLEQSSQEGGTESRGESESAVCVALPPSVSTSSYNEVVLTGSTALDVLDQLLANNEIGKERAARLRRKYNELRDNLNTSRQLENTLLVEAKSLEAQLSQQNKVLERGQSFPEGDNSVSGGLRQNLLTHQNQLDQSSEKVEKLDAEIVALKEELGQLERQYSRQPKREEIEQRIRELTRDRDDFKSEIKKRESDVQRLREDLDKKNFKCSVIRQETDELLQLVELLQSELIEIRNQPSIPKEIDNVKREQREVKEKIKAQNECLAELQPQITESESRSVIQRSELTAVVRELKESEKNLESEQIHLNLLNKDVSTAKEREATLLEDRASLELCWKHACMEHRSMFESLSAKNKEKERELKGLKKAELQLASLKDQKEKVVRKLTALKSKADNQKANCEALREAREEVARETEQLRHQLALAVGDSDEHTAHVNKLQLTEQKLKGEIKRQLTILRDLGKETVTMTRSRDIESKELSKARRSQRNILEDTRTKESEIGDHRKKIAELQVKLKDFAAAYEVVKIERNKIHSQIQLLQQVGAEMTEKSKVLSNEAEILRSTTVTKERLLQKCSLVTTAKQMERDTQRQELAKLRQSQEELGSELEVSREAICKLTQQINTAEQQLNRLRRHYEQSVQDRNDLGLQLIERNEEVCVFYEKMNIQESRLRKANMELAAREEEMKFLNMEISRLQNDLLVTRKSAPVKDKLEVDLVTGQLELQQCQERLQELGEAVECASDPARLRLLSGDNPSRNQLSDKIDTLESKLSEREQQLLEKELLYEQVCKLTDRDCKRVEGQRDSTLTVAKKVNKYQSKIKESNRKMMALVSELSMTQAQALALQQESREAELKLEQAYTRMANGEPPNEECREQWEKMIKQKERRQVEEMMKSKLLAEEEERTLPDGAISHADYRPNAYMPTGEDELPIPKPYGSHAPFKPSLPGANLRHIRKPEPKPIDI